MSATILITYTFQPFLFRQLMKIRYYSRRFGSGKPGDVRPQEDDRRLKSTETD